MHNPYLRNACRINGDSSLETKFSSLFCSHVFSFFPHEGKKLRAPKEIPIKEDKTRKMTFALWKKGILTESTISLKFNNPYLVK